MFEIRIICDPDDTDRVTTALDATFTTGAVRRLPTRDGARTRLYITADHRPAPEHEWPAPETAYAQAPSILSEIGWIARAAADRPFGTEAGREFWLRKAALLDRIALGDETAPAVDHAAEASTRAARRLMELDGTTIICDPRHYVRQQYAHWTTHP
ncbi:hypothetical protein [Streptomyces sp. NPDC001966]